MVLDLIKERSDDAFFSEEHVIFILDKMRALLLERKYKNSRNQSFTSESDDNKQTICIELEASQLSPDVCGPMWLKSTKKIPDVLGDSSVEISTISDMYHSMVTFIPAERMPYVGYNKWLKNIIYAAKSGDGYLYLQSDNPQFLHLEKAKLKATFSNSAEAEALACEGDDSGACDIMDKKFPVEDSLVLSCIELTVQELAGPRYAPEDKSNNARDEFGTGNSGYARSAGPAERIRSRREARDAAKEQQGAAE